MKTILVPVDFSAAAANAVEFAGNLAAFYGAQLWLYHSYDLPVPISEYVFPTASHTEMQDAYEQEVEDFKKEIQSRLRFPIRIKSKTEMSNLREGLDAFCDTIKPDLVIMGLSGKTGFTKTLTGSNTIKAIHYLKYPVLVIPPKATFMPIRKIGFACDYDRVSEHTPISMLEKIVHDFNAELYVVNVHPHNKDYSHQELLEGMFAGELLKRVRPEYHTIDSDNVTEGINWFANKAHLDWIVAIPKKHNLAESFFKHSHTKDLLYHTHVPVLCMHE